MEPSQLSNKLKNSRIYRKKLLSYSISHEKKQTDTNRASLSKSSQIHEESTNPSPWSKKIINKEEFLVESKKISIPTFKSSIFDQSLSNSKKNSSINDNSPRKIETLTSFNTKVNTVNNTSRKIPNSDEYIQISNYSKTPRYESHQNSLSFENFDPPLYSARSGMNFRDNSVDISPIIEESSLCENISQGFIHLSIENNSFHDVSPGKPHRNVSNDFSPLRQISKLSLQGSYEYHSDNEGEKIGNDSSPTKFSEKNHNLIVISFEEAVVMFKSLKLEFFDQNLWIPGWKEQFCCVQTEDLDEDSHEICEKLIVFAYFGFIKTDVFHKRLLISVFEILQSYNKDKVLMTDIGFSSPDPYNSDLTHDTAALGLLQILFIDRYLPTSLSDMISYCLESNMAFILIAFDISEISITSLRRKTLNKLIGKTNKPLETVFFLYAGCLLYWFSTHKTHQQIPSVINSLTEKMAYKQPGVLIDLAKENFYLQSERL